MLAVPVLRRRRLLQACAQDSVCLVRFWSDGRNSSSKAASRKWSEQKEKSSANGDESSKLRVKSDEPSLFEQLFPDQEAELRKEHEREVARIPLKHHGAPRRPASRPFGDYDPNRPSLAAQRLEQQMESRPSTGIGVLVLRNASKSLTEDDFRRLIPQGRHMEGWNLEQGDILKVIPGRDWQTLAQQNFYYLLFSSALSAFTYQGHTTRVHRLVAQHTPSSMLSPMLPPPGYLVQGMDVHAAIESFSLVPPNQELDLRQLKPPLTAFMESIVRNRGYSNLLSRKDKMPYEARLTLEGQQLHLTHIRHIFMLSGKDRGLSWSGDSNVTPRLVEWKHSTQFLAPSPMSNKQDALRWEYKSEIKASGKVDLDVTRLDNAVYEDDVPNPNQQEQEKRRTGRKIYIVGFETENAMQSFVHYWHRRPMDWEGFERKDGEDDLAPITNVEVLW